MEWASLKIIEFKYMHNLPEKSKTNLFFFFFVAYSLCELLEAPVHIILIESCVL